MLNRTLKPCLLAVVLTGMPIGCTQPQSDIQSALESPTEKKDCCPHDDSDDVAQLIENIKPSEGTDFHQKKEVDDVSASKLTLSLTDVHGASVQPLNPGEKVAVLVFITTDCPIANAASPELNRIHKAYEAQGVNMTLVHVDPDVNAEMAAGHASDYELSPTIVVDKGHQLVRLTGVQTTPETAVIAPDGHIAYRGRINNQFAAYGDRRRTASEHNLRDAIDAVLAGRPVEKPRVRALGCFIPQ